MSAESWEVKTTPQNIEANPYFSYDELMRVLIEYSSSMRTQNFSESKEEWEEEEQKSISKILEKLLENKEKFASVFKTENGSMYFVLQTGESFRIKKYADKEEYELEPIFTNIFFIDPADGDKLNSIIENGDWNLVETRLPVTSLRPGVLPLELGNREKGTETIWREEEGVLVITPIRKINGSFISIKGVNMYHPGHVVTEIIKN